MKVEKRSFDFIPEEERHGKPRSLFNIWFSANMQIAVLVTGGLAVSLGLNIFWALVAAVIGNLIGGIFMALHSVQGPRLGIPQMIQSRAQFGMVGASLPLVLVIILYLGSYAAGAILGAQALHNMFPFISVTWGLIILGAITFIITLFGYELIHMVERYLTIIFAVVFIAVTVVVLQMDFPTGSFAVSDFHLPTFLMIVSMMAAFQLSYGPYVADYSRYLPSDVSSKATFGYSYAGSVIGTIWMMGLGILLIGTIPGFVENQTYYFSHLLGDTFVTPMYIVLILGVIGVNVLNLYGAFMSTTTTISSFVDIKSNQKSRFWLVLATAIASTVLGLLGQSDLMEFLELFANFIILVMIPWSTINLVDFFFVRHGKYRTEDFFDMDGEYGRFNWIGIGALVISVLLELPFISTDGFTGFVAKWLGGADFSWVIGLVVPFILYYFPMKKRLKNVSSSTLSKAE